MKRLIFISLLSFGLVSLFQMPMSIAHEDDDLHVSGVGQDSGLQESTRLNWGSGNNASTTTNSSISSQVVSAPPGAPELPASMMFGGGLFVLGFGLLLTRRLW